MLFCRTLSSSTFVIFVNFFRLSVAFHSFSLKKELFRVRTYISIEILENNKQTNKQNHKLEINETKRKEKNMENVVKLTKTSKNHLNERGLSLRCNSA